MFLYIKSKLIKLVFKKCYIYDFNVVYIYIISLNRHSRSRRLGTFLASEAS